MSPRIRIKPVFFDGAIIGEPALSFRQQNTPLTRLVLQMATACESLPAFKTPTFRLPEADRVEAELPSVPGSDIEIELVLIDNPELMCDWDVPDSALGFHALTVGAFERVDGVPYSAQHRVVMLVDEQALREHLAESRAEEMDPTSSRYDREHLEAWLITLTHELAHAVEFIENGNGLSPNEAFNLWDEGALSYSLFELESGNGMRIPYDDVATRDVLLEHLEDRIEALGREWFHALPIDRKLIAAVARHYAPKDLELDGPGGP